MRSRLRLVFLVILSLGLFVVLAAQTQAATISKPPINLGLVGYWDFEVGKGGTIAYDRSGNSGNGTLVGMDPSTDWVDGKEGKGQALDFDGPDTTATTATDVSGTGNTGTLTNGPVPGIGKVGQALNFDGSNDFVDLANPASLNITSALTISAWVYVRGATNQIDDIFTRDNSSTNRGYRLVFDSNDSIEFYVAQDASTKIQATVTGRTPYQNRWVHVVGVYQPSTFVRLYLDGTQAAENTMSIPAAIRSSTVGPEIGRRGNGDGEFNGLIDEVRVYNRALSAEEVKRLYNMGKTTIRH